MAKRYFSHGKGYSRYEKDFTNNEIMDREGQRFHKRQMAEIHSKTRRTVARSAAAGAYAAPASQALEKEDKYPQVINNTENNYYGKRRRAKDKAQGNSAGTTEENLVNTFTYYHDTI